MKVKNMMSKIKSFDPVFFSFLSRSLLLRTKFAYKAKERKNVIACIATVSMVCWYSFNVDKSNGSSSLNGGATWAKHKIPYIFELENQFCHEKSHIHTQTKREGENSESSSFRWLWYFYILFFCRLFFFSFHTFFAIEMEIVSDSVA